MADTHPCNSYSRSRTRIYNYTSLSRPARRMRLPRTMAWWAISSCRVSQSCQAWPKALIYLIFTTTTETVSNKMTSHRLQSTILPFSSSRLRTTQTTDLRRWTCPTGLSTTRVPVSLQGPTSTQISKAQSDQEHKTLSFQVSLTFLFYRYSNWF